jgi:hypothetical protein
VRRASVLALLDATMSDLRHQGFDDDLTEVNLDLEGALESALEEETRIAPAARRPHVPVALKPPTVSLRAPASWVEDLLVKEEFAYSDDDDLPMLDSSEFMAAPRTDDLSPPEVSLIAPEPPLIWPVNRVPRAEPKSVRIVVGTPIIAIHAEKKAQPQPKNGGMLWVSAIALWAATILGAWTLRMELFELIGL